MVQTEQVITYQPKDGKLSIKTILKNETIWLTQAQMAELFKKSKKTISEHIQNIFHEGELEENSVVRKFRTTAEDGKAYLTTYYDLDVIISVGYRVKSKRGTQFRIWATHVLKEYIKKGYVLDDDRLSKKDNSRFEELVERVRHIRSSEKGLFEKIKAIFSTSTDYDPQSESAQLFFATVQNKFHYAIHHHTACELIVERVSGQQPFLGLTNWSSKRITLNQAMVAKNYLHENEIERLELLTEQFLSFAELRYVEGIPMKMEDWLRKLKAFLVLNDKVILDHAGCVSRKDMEKKVRSEYQKYKSINRKENSNN